MLLSTLLALALSVPAAKAADWPDLSTPLARTDEGRKDAVVLVAVEDYARLPDVPGAVASADAWLRWFVGVRGVPPSRVFKAYGAEVTPATLRELARQAAQAVQPGGTPWLVFIGRGDADAASGASTVLTQAAEPTPASVAEAGVTVASLVSALEANGQARAVALVDAAGCRPAPAGAAPEGLKGLRGHVLVSCGAEGVAPAVPGIVGPTFPYLALGAVGGWADVDGVGNRDGRVSASEVDEYVLGVLNLAVRGPRPTLLRMGTDLDVGKAVRAPAPDVLAMSLSAPAAPAPAARPAPPPRAPRTAVRWPHVRLDAKASGGTYAYHYEPHDVGSFGTAQFYRDAFRYLDVAAGVELGARATWDGPWAPSVAARLAVDGWGAGALQEDLCANLGLARCPFTSSDWRSVGPYDLLTDATVRVGVGRALTRGAWRWTPRVHVGGSIRNTSVYGGLSRDEAGSLQYLVSAVDVASVSVGGEVAGVRGRATLQAEAHHHVSVAGRPWATEGGIEAGWHLSPRTRATLGGTFERRALTLGVDEGSDASATVTQSFTRARLGMSFDL
jgi:hypothetical protein